MGQMDRANASHSTRMGSVFDTMNSDNRMFTPCNLKSLNGQLPFVSYEQNIVQIVNSLGTGPPNYLIPVWWFCENCVDAKLTCFGNNVRIA